MPKHSTSVQIGIYSLGKELSREIARRVRKLLSNFGLEYTGPVVQYFHKRGSERWANVYFRRFTFEMGSNDRAKNIIQKTKKMGEGEERVYIQIGIGVDSYEPSLKQASEEFEEKVLSYINSKHNEEETESPASSEEADSTENEEETVSEDIHSNNGQTQTGQSYVSSQINKEATDGTSHKDASLEKLRKRAEKAARKNPVREQVTTMPSQYHRSGVIKEYARARAGGTCESCGEPAPFNDKDGQPYLEVHHVEELGEGGSDSPDMVAAICPTCHTRIHYGEDGERLNQSLIDSIK